MLVLTSSSCSCHAGLSRQPSLARSGGALHQQDRSSVGLHQRVALLSLSSTVLRPSQTQLGRASLHCSAAGGSSSGGGRSSSSTSSSGALTAAAAAAAAAADGQWEVHTLTRGGVQEFLMAADVVAEALFEEEDQEQQMLDALAANGLRAESEWATSSSDSDSGASTSSSSSWSSGTPWQQQQQGSSSGGGNGGSSGGSSSRGKKAMSSTLAYAAYRSRLASLMLVRAATSAAGHATAVARGRAAGGDAVYVGVAEVLVQPASKQGLQDALKLPPSSSIAVISNMAVRSECRRKGLGRLLLRACEDAAKGAPGAPAVAALFVVKYNEAALRLYAGEGFRVVEGWTDPAWLAAAEKGSASGPRRLLMRKDLR